MVNSEYIYGLKSKDSVLNINYLLLNKHINFALWKLVYSHFYGLFSEKQYGKKIFFRMLNFSYIFNLKYQRIKFAVLYKFIFELKKITRKNIECSEDESAHKYLLLYLICVS